MFGLLKSVTKAAINTVTLPVSVAKDFVTLDTFESNNATERNVDRLKGNLRKIEKELADY